MVAARGLTDVALVEVVLDLSGVVRDTDECTTTGVMVGMAHVWFRTSHPSHAESERVRFAPTNMPCLSFPYHGTCLYNCDWL